jgi:hypothetical protein
MGMRWKEEFALALHKCICSIVSYFLDILPAQSNENEGNLCRRWGSSWQETVMSRNTDVPLLVLHTNVYTAVEDDQTLQ